MSELSEEFLNEDNVDFGDIEPVDEEALLQDDEDVLNLDETQEEEPLDSSQNSGTDEIKHSADNEEGTNVRKDKFATERKIITAPESSGNEQSCKLSNPNQFKKFNKNNNRGRNRGRAGRFQHYQNRPQPYNQDVYKGNRPGRNKTVLINPRFQGVVHVNNNARLAWDAQPQDFPPSSWLPNSNHTNGPPMHQMMQPPPPMPGMHQGSIQFQPPPQQYAGGPPQMQPPSHNMIMMNQPPPIERVFMMNQGPPLHQPPPMHNTSFPPPQMMRQCFRQQNQPQNYMGPPLTNQVFHEPPMPPGVPPTAEQFWQQHYPGGFPQSSTLQTNNPYQNFDPPPQQPLNLPPPQFNSHQQTYVRTVHPREEYLGDKIAPESQPQKRKRLIHERLGKVDQPTLKIKKLVITGTDSQMNRVVKKLRVTSVTKVQSDEDEKTRDLRLKIEEQKRKREEVLKWKEARRLQNLNKTPETPQLNQQQPIQSVQRPINGHMKNRLIHHNQNRGYQQAAAGSGRTPVLRQVMQVDEQRVNTAGLNSAVETAGAQTDVDVQLDKKHLSNFLAGRTVLAKDEALLSTRRVMVKNLASSTPDKKLFQICKGIGEVQNLHRDKNDRQATITFKGVASAHAFFKKYRRHMLDLSMIEVSLAPDSDGQDGN